MIAPSCLTAQSSWVVAVIARLSWCDEPKRLRDRILHVAARRTRHARYADLLDRVRGADALNIDETGWRLKDAQRALWGAFTDRHAVFAIASSRHEDHARDLLADTNAIVTSDRWWAYGHLPVKRRQVCWSHLQRDFAMHADGLGAEKDLGEAGLRVCEQLFWAWEIFQHTGDRAELKRRIRRLRRELKPILTRHAAKGVRYRHGRGFARNLLKIWPALRTFDAIDGVHPTNNHAERRLRDAVIARKPSLGSQSVGGERRIERLLSTHTTCRQQQRSLHAYLIDLLGAHARGDPIPLLASSTNGPNAYVRLPPATQPVRSPRPTTRLVQCLGFSW